jgi:hypothetical protein
MMNEQPFVSAGPARTPLNLAIAVLLAGGMSVGTTDAAAGSGKTDKVCTQTASIAFKACGNDVKDNYLIAQGKCLNLTDAAEKATCLADAKSTSQDDKSQCSDVRNARNELCGALTMGGGPYDPPLDPDNFVSSADQIVGNTYFPLKRGTKWVYVNNAVPPETITVTVTDQTTEIAGIPVVAVTDVATVDGNTTENTVDWYAQDTDGNVWYFGENTMATNPDNMLTSVDGAWETGVEGAKPGIVMPAVFTVGEVYRQEFLLGDAEDVAENLSSTDATASVPTLNNATPVWVCNGICLKTHEYSPIEPDTSESKFYLPDVGVILTLDDNDPTFREELVEFTPGS